MSHSLVPRLPQRRRLVWWTAYSVLVPSAAVLTVQSGCFAKVQIVATNVDQAIKASCKRLDYVGLKLDQEKAIRSFVSGQDVFLSLLTSSGASLLYHDELHDAKGKSSQRCHFWSCGITCHMTSMYRNFHKRRGASKCEFLGISCSNNVTSTQLHHLQSIHLCSVTSCHMTTSQRVYHL